MNNCSIWSIGEALTFSINESLNFLVSETTLNYTIEKSCSYLPSTMSVSPDYVIDGNDGQVLDGDGDPIFGWLED